MRKAKRNYEISVARQAKADPKPFYHLYNTKHKQKIGPFRSQTGESLSDHETSTALNNYFLSVFTQEDVTSLPNATQLFEGEDHEMLCDFNITKETVMKEIDKLKKTKSPGPDDIFPRVLKEARDVVSEPLANIFRKSLDTGVVPSIWKKANVVPIFKKGDKTDMSNYRPISLTSVVGKLFESIIAKNIRDHLDKHNLIKGSQHDFVKGKSCLTNLLSFYKKVYEAADNNDDYDIIYLDFSKAFDKVPHQRLLSKVKAHGIEGKVFRWIKEWLSDRKQRVQVNGEKSDWGCVTSGVPQGSVLGPLLFIIYIYDLDCGIASDISKFADDTKIGRKVKSATDAAVLQDDLKALYDWSSKWMMQFNVNKCSVLSVGRNNPQYDYTLNNTVLSHSSCERDLGVRVSSDLRPRNHCIAARNRANRALGFISRSVSHRSAEVILRLYLALVRPHLDYAVQFWSPYYKKDIDSLESVQRRMTKMIQGIRNLPYKDRLKELNLHSLQRRRLRGDLIEVFKWIKGINKGDLYEVLIPKNDTRTRGNGYKLDKFRFRKDIGKNWFTNRVVDQWNKLSKYVVDANSIESFKWRLDKFMDGEGSW